MNCDVNFQALAGYTGSGNRCIVKIAGMKYLIFICKLRGKQIIL